MAGTPDSAPRIANNREASILSKYLHQRFNGACEGIAQGIFDVREEVAGLEDQIFADTKPVEQSSLDLQGRATHRDYHNIARSKRAGLDQLTAIILFCFHIDRKRGAQRNLR